MSDRDYRASLSGAAFQAYSEATRAIERHPRPFSSAHEGYAVLLEEVEELWDEVKKGGTEPRSEERIRREATQVAAMAIRFLVDVCDVPGKQS